MWQMLSRIVDETDDEEDLPAVLDVVEITDAVSLLDLKTCFLTNAMSLCRTPDGELVYGAYALFTEHIGLFVAGPIPFPRNVWGSEEGINGTFVGLSRATNAGGEYSDNSALTCDC